MAAAFSNNSRPTFPGDRRWAAMPEPITTAARKALPINSASRRRQRAWSLIAWLLIRAANGSKPATGQQQDDGDPVATRSGRLAQHAVPLGSAARNSPGAISASPRTV